MTTIFHRSLSPYIAVALALGVLTTSPASAQRAEVPEDLSMKAVYYLMVGLGHQVEAIARDLDEGCDRDVSSVLSAPARLPELDEAGAVLLELKRKYGREVGFPSGQEQRTSARIAGLRDALLRIQASSNSQVCGADPVPHRAERFEAAARFVCPGQDQQASVFDDVCKIQGGTPGEECHDCGPFGWFTCCESICTVL